MLSASAIVMCRTPAKIKLHQHGDDFSSANASITTNSVLYNFILYTVYNLLRTVLSLLNSRIL